jgi:flagellar hook protein FlgE
MSLFGALTTGVSGMNAQSRAMGNISENLANTQTTASPTPPRGTTHRAA